MRMLLIFSLILTTIACKSSKEICETPDSKSTQQMITATIDEINIPSDPLTITDIRVKNNKMFIDIQYSGGCELHTFKVNGSVMIAKSLPPIRAIQIVHTANGDQCKKLIMETLEVDIKALAYKQEVGSTIFLTTDGWKERIEYTFN